MTNFWVSQQPCAKISPQKQTHENLLSSISWSEVGIFGKKHVLRFRASRSSFSALGVFFNVETAGRVDEK